MQHVPGFFAIYSRLKKRRNVVIKKKANSMGSHSMYETRNRLALNASAHLISSTYV